MAPITPSKGSESSATKTWPKTKISPLTPDEVSVWRALHVAAQNTETDHRLRAFYDRLDKQIQNQKPTCWISGRCCNFKAYGHRLYVTGLEIVWVLVQMERSPNHDTHTTLLNHTVFLEKTCPLMINHLCSIHMLRPMGCRIFFCQAGTNQWQNKLYEQCLHELKTLHNTLGIPYRYLEWCEGLKQATQALFYSDHEKF